MTKKQIKQLILASYTKDKLDQKKVEKVAKFLKKKDLKLYVKGLKNNEKKKEVVIAVPSASVYNTSKKIFFDAFPGKSITVREDKLLMLGSKVTADDMVYDFSLKKKLEDFLHDIEDNYDEE